MPRARFTPNRNIATTHGVAKRIAVLLFLIAVIGMYGCGKTVIQSSPEPTAPSKPSKPYTIKGQTYYPVASANGFKEDGVASWYGEDFHGKKTANGEIYDMYAMTAAHKLLPFNTKVRVTNLDNGKTVDVRINDRGPFVKGRIIDLSYTAAQRIAMVGPGTARVKLQALTAVPGYTPEDNNFYGEFYIQIGSFTVRKNAESKLSLMLSKGYSRSRIQPARVGGKRFWRVQVGPYLDLKTAQNAQSKLAASYPSSFIIAD